MYLSKNTNWTNLQQAQNKIKFLKIHSKGVAHDAFKDFNDAKTNFDCDSIDASKTASSMQNQEANCHHHRRKWSIMYFQTKRRMNMWKTFYAEHKLL